MFFDETACVDTASTVGLDMIHDVSDLNFVRTNLIKNTYIYLV